MRSHTRFIGLSAVAAFAALALAGCSLFPQPQATRDESGEIVEGGQESALRMQVGDCWNDVTSEAITDVPMVPCAEPHDNEVYATFDLPDGDFPGEAATEVAALEGCAERFEAYVGISSDESVLQVYPVWPTQSSWEEFDDRLIVCSLWDEAGQMTGTEKGSKR